MNKEFNIGSYFKKQYLEEIEGSDISIEPAMEKMLSSAIDIFEAATDLDGFGEQFDEEDILEMINTKIKQAIGPRMG